MDVSAETDHYFDNAQVTGSSRARFSNAMMPWADLSGLASAAAASITVAMALWDRLRRSRRPKEHELKTASAPQQLDEQEIEELATEVKKNGVLGTEIATVEVDDIGRSVRVTVKHEFTDETFRFRLCLGATEIELGLEPNHRA